MKVSVSLPPEDVAFLDDHAKRLGYPSRSSALHEAVRLLRRVELADAYESAFADWDSGGDADVWDEASGDGLD